MRFAIIWNFINILYRKYVNFIKKLNLNKKNKNKNKIFFKLFLS